MNLDAMSQRQAETGRQKVLSCSDRFGSANENSRLLDVGCGDGELSLEFAGRMGVKRIYGVDVDEPALEKAKSRGIFGEKVDLNNGTLPFPGEFFDFVLCHQVAEHLRNPDNVFQEIWRVMKTGGQCVLSVPNLCSCHNRLLVLLGQHPTVIYPSTRYQFGNPMRLKRLEIIEGHRHNTAFSPSALREMLKFYGFTIDNYYGSGLHPFGDGISKWILKLFPGLGVIQIAVVTKTDSAGDGHGK